MEATGFGLGEQLRTDGMFVTFHGASTVRTKSVKPTKKSPDQVYQELLEEMLTMILEADDRGELHRDPLDTDELFTKARKALRKKK